MTAAEKKAVKARVEDLVKQGVDRKIAEVMAKVEIEYGIINTVVNY